MVRFIISYILLVPLHLICWLMGLLLAMVLFQQDVPDGDGGFDFTLLLVSALHVLALLAYLLLSRRRGWNMIFRLTIIAWGLTYLINQVESFWFINSLNLTPALIYSLLTGGLIGCFAFSCLAVLFVPSPARTDTLSPPVSNAKTLSVVILLMLVIWPMIYFLAGYYIAWQSEAVRIFYTGSAELRSFGNMMVMNIKEGLYYFQIFRTLIWIFLAMVILQPLQSHSVFVRIFLTGTLFAVLGSSQLLLENPVMPEPVRTAHLLETAISTFAWGGILGWVCGNLFFRNADTTIGKVAGLREDSVAI